MHQLAHRRLGLAAERALEIAVLDERHRGVFAAADVVALGVDRLDQVDELVGVAQAGPGLAAGPGSRRSAGRPPR